MDKLAAVSRTKSLCPCGVQRWSARARKLTAKCSLRGSSKEANQALLGYAARVRLLTQLGRSQQKSLMSSSIAFDGDELLWPPRLWQQERAQLCTQPRLCLVSEAYMHPGPVCSAGLVQGTCSRISSVAACLQTQVPEAPGLGLRSAASSVAAGSVWQCLGCSLSR